MVSPPPPPPQRGITSTRPASQSDDDLGGRDALVDDVDGLLDLPDALADDDGLGRGDEGARRERRRQEVVVDGLADGVVLERGAEDGVHLDAGRRLGPAALRRRDALVALGRGEHLLQDALGRAADAVERAARRLALERFNKVVLDRGARVVEDLAGAEPLGVREVLGGGRGEDLVAGADEQLDGVAADGGGAAPDDHGLARGRPGRDRGQLELEVGVLEEAAGGGRQG